MFPLDFKKSPGSQTRKTEKCLVLRMRRWEMASLEEVRERQSHEFLVPNHFKNWGDVNKFSLFCLSSELGLSLNVEKGIGMRSGPF